MEVCFPFLRNSSDHIHISQAHTSRAHFIHFSPILQSTSPPTRTIPSSFFPSHVRKWSFVLSDFMSRRTSGHVLLSLPPFFPTSHLHGQRRSRSRSPVKVSPRFWHPNSGTLDISPIFPRTRQPNARGLLIGKGFFWPVACVAHHESRG